VNVDEPGLFDLPETAAPTPLTRPVRGRNRETWARIVTAEITVLDADALREAVARMEEGGVRAGLGAEPDAEDTTVEDRCVPTATEALDAVAWLTWPADGLEPLLETGAIRVLSMAREVVAEAADRGTLVWTVTVKLTDVEELRRVATRAHPDEAASIAVSLAVAWERAADPFAPLRSIPGIGWRSGRVDVQHLPRRGPVR